MSRVDEVGTTAPNVVLACSFAICKDAWFDDLVRDQRPWFRIVVIGEGNYIDLRMIVVELGPTWKWGLDVQTVFFKRTLRRVKDAVTLVDSVYEEDQFFVSSSVISDSPVIWLARTTRTLGGTNEANQSFLLLSLASFGYETSRVSSLTHCLAFSVKRA